MNFNEPAFAQCPTLLGAQPESPECEQFDSAQEDVEEEGGATSALDAEPDASMGKETEASECSPWVPSAERHHQRNRAMRRERTRACREFRGPKNKHLSFLLFRETTKEDAISYRDWHSEIEDACREAMTPPRLRKLCSRPWRGWPGTMPR